MLYNFLRISVHWSRYILLLTYDFGGDSQAFKKLAWTRKMNSSMAYNVVDERLLTMNMVCSKGRYLAPISASTMKKGRRNCSRSSSCDRTPHDCEL